MMYRHYFEPQGLEAKEARSATAVSPNAPDPPRQCQTPLKAKGRNFHLKFALFSQLTPLKIVKMSIKLLKTTGAPIYIDTNQAQLQTSS
jgi:hypothetical protein